MSPTGGAAAAAAIAAARKRREQEEEEKLASYDSDDLSGWEFKIVRSELGKFRDREFVRKVCQEEARAGWEMLEKFDDNRIRFKRRVDRRAQDAHLGFDPYRTSVGPSGGAVALIIVVGVLAVIGAVVLTIYALQ
jgi:hypothetical protein